MAPLWISGMTENSKGPRWTQFNFDTGAAVSAIPRKIVDEEQKLPTTGQWYRTASGERIEDYGERTLCGQDEQDVYWRLKGRVSDVHKCLVSAAKMAVNGHNMFFLDAEGGYAISEYSEIGKGLRRELN